ncbi:hypothetical protein Tco_1508772 [Tanacetum coccineum]
MQNSISKITDQLRVPDVPTYESDDEQISWKSSEEDDDDEVNVSEDDDDDNDDDVDKDDEDDDADNQDDANQDADDEQTDSDNDEESDDESNEDSDEEVQGENIEEEEMDEEATHEEDEANELYRDVYVNLEGRNTEMTDASLPNVQGTQVTEDTHVIITALVNPEGIDSIFTLNTEATSLVDVPVTTIAEPPLFIKFKEFQRSLCHSDTERLSRSDEVLKLKNFKKDATLKLFKSTNQESYEHVGPEVTRSHGGKIYQMTKQDYAWLMISRCSTSHSRQAKEQAKYPKSMITTSNHKIND